VALLPSEVERLKYELGYNALTIGAMPYMGYVSLFDQVVIPYLQAGALTDSTTAVTASTTGPVPVPITLTDPTGFDRLARVVIDVDSRQEFATVQSIAGSVITVQLFRAHSGSYPITVEGGETMVRQALLRCINVAIRIDKALAAAGIKKAEEVEWYQSLGGGSAVLDSLNLEQRRRRDELASLIGMQNLWTVRSGRGGSVALY
jgi:hypothetical protein